MSARAREGKRNETRARRREAKRAGESRDAIDDEVSSRCIASRIARSLHTFCKSSCIDRSIRRRSRASRASRPSRARIPHRDAREARRRRASAEDARESSRARLRSRVLRQDRGRLLHRRRRVRGIHVGDRLLSQSLSNRSRASTRGGKDARRVSANAWRARRGERRFQNLSLIHI